MTDVPAIDIYQVTDEEKAEYTKFGLHHVQTVGRAMPEKPLWHYTSAEALVDILRTGRLFSTQISCLNDSRERMYFGDLILEELAKRQASNTDSRLDVLYKTAFAALSNRNVFTAGYFVTCFSEAEDDLSQWKGYGNGEAGYAIGFDPKLLITAAAGIKALVFPMTYDAKKHSFLVDEIVKHGEVYFLAGLARGRTSLEQWAGQFVYWYALASEAFTCTIKHPKFLGEAERRLAIYFDDSHRSLLEIRPKRTLLARHLPLDLTIDVEGKRVLPISRIFVGPGPGQKVSAVAVYDLLAVYGYKNVTVELSTVPYRAV